MAEGSPLPRGVRFSIVIPLHRDSDSFRQSLDGCLGLPNDDFEVIVASDRDIVLPNDPRVQLVLTGSPTDTSPAEKRDQAMAKVSGAVVAYLDDDAFPDPTWLTVAGRRFDNPDVGALGGPGLTPPQSAFRERVGGAVYESRLGSGPLNYRFVPRAPDIVDDYPAYNLFVRSSLVEAVGGWGTTFYGGEDTYFCEALKRAGVLVHYDPELIVFHHRRPIFRPHMRQIANVGRHRGFFARQPGTSRRLVYMLPLVAMALGVLAAVAFVVARPLIAITAGGVAYAALALSSQRGGVAVRATFPLALLAHHASYAIGFLRGLFVRKLER